MYKMKMKKILVSGWLATLFFACESKSAGEIGQYTTIEYQEVYDMGTVAKGEIIRVEIKLKNTGTYPLLIADVKPACSCTVPSYERNPIQPGQEAVIIAEVDTDKTGKGLMSKPINITANTQPSGTKIIIKAKVID